MIYTYLIVGFIICGLKFPFDVATGENADRYRIMAEQDLGLSSHDPRIEDALLRIRTNYNKRTLSHNLTNLPIEVTRYWVQTYEQTKGPHMPNATAGVVKGVAALVVWPPILFTLWKVLTLCVSIVRSTAARTRQ